MFFSLNLSSGGNQKTKKAMGAGNIKKKKKVEQEVCNDLLQEIGVNDRELYFKLLVQWTF